MALVHHKFWSRPKLKTRMNSIRSRGGHLRAFSMYFDDRERLQDFEGKLNKPVLGDVFSRKNDEKPWITSLSDEKRLAMEKFLGYNAKSVSELTDEQVEEETLRWVADTDIVSSVDEEAGPKSIESFIQESTDQKWVSTIKYDGIKDLLVASSCHSKLESLSFLWDTIADTFEEKNLLQSSPCSKISSSVLLIVFPKSECLWNYNTMVTMLESIKIAQPLLPPHFDLKLDLFHPNYKHSPRIFSPQWHSPFPTIGLTIKAKKPLPIDEWDMKRVRSKLDILFQSGDASERNTECSNSDHDQILADSQFWLKKHENEKIEQAKTNTIQFDEGNIDWIVQSQASPFQLYRTIWNTAAYLSNNKKRSLVVVDPFLDSYTLHRIAITVNAALKRLNIPFRVSQVYHPFTNLMTTNHDYTKRPPYGMIQLTPVPLKEHK